MTAALIELAGAVGMFLTVLAWERGWCQPADWTPEEIEARTRAIQANHAAGGYCAEPCCWDKDGDWYDA